MTEEPRVRVQVDDTRCVGIGACVEAEPGAFELGDEGVSRPVEGVRLALERAQHVCRECPSGAISIVAEDGVS